MLTLSITTTAFSRDELADDLEEIANDIRKTSVVADGCANIDGKQLDIGYTFSIQEHD